MSYGVSKWTVYHLSEQKRATGSVALRTSQRGRKQLVSDEDKRKIRQCIDLSRRYGRSIGHRRVVDHVPLNTPQRLTVLSSIRWDGHTAFTTYSGGTTGERFVSYLEKVLLPTLKPGDIVVMDNMKAHHVKAVEQTLCAAGMIPVYLPPDSPHMNPIEMLWFKFKSILRKWGIRLAADMPDAVRLAFALLRPIDCQHWFAADGYCR